MVSTNPVSACQKAELRTADSPALSSASQPLPSIGIMCEGMASAFAGTDSEVNTPQVKSTSRTSRPGAAGQAQHAQLGARAEHQEALHQHATECMQALAELEFVKVQYSVDNDTEKFKQELTRLHAIVKRPVPVPATARPNLPAQVPSEPNSRPRTRAPPTPVTRAEMREQMLSQDAAHEPMAEAQEEGEAEQEEENLDALEVDILALRAREEARAAFVISRAHEARAAAANASAPAATVAAVPLQPAPESQAAEEAEREQSSTGVAPEVILEESLEEDDLEEGAAVATAAPAPPAPAAPAEPPAEPPAPPAPAQMAAVELGKRPSTPPKVNAPFKVPKPVPPAAAAPAAPAVAASRAPRSRTAPRQFGA